ncbi:MAG: coenzyme F420-0:L-glutamate ligase [Candidatus Paceibacterota bacterium]
MKVIPIKTRIFKENENLINFITSNIKKLEDNSILVITSKVVALSEGRVVIIKNEKEKEALIKSESQFAMRTKFSTHRKYVWLTIKDGMVLAGAGIDESNANGKVILLPKDSFQSASILRRKLLKYYNVKNLGIIISDSRILPLRAGIVGVALGYAGFKGVRDYRNTKDLFGRNLEFSRTDVADSLATGAVLLMGEGRESQPLAIITDSKAVFVDKINKNELSIDPKDDLYQPLFANIKKIKLKK